MPESARYYITHNREDKAMKVMRRVAWWNHRTLPEVCTNDERERGGVLSVWLKHLDAIPVVVSSRPTR